ncbi:MAG: hypothetical protein MUD08_03075 [Cytophagales bacterium]|nr:hypothetical protein [Cytophagales bacterium]
MKDHNMGALVAKRVAYSAAIMAGIVALFMGLTYWQNNTTTLDWRLWTFIGFWGFALAIDTYRFVVRNELAQTRVQYGDAETGLDRIEAILVAMGYELSQKQGNQAVYQPSVYVGRMNRPVTVETKARHAVVEGPAFAINRLEQRVEDLNYVDMKVGEAASVPFGGSAADDAVPARYGTSEAEVFNPKTA